MNKNYMSDADLKKLMKIIYEKQKQIDKYKKMVKNKSKQLPCECDNANQLLFEQRALITQEINQNRESLASAMSKMNTMQDKIYELEKQLKGEEEKANWLENQIQRYKVELEIKDKEVIRVEEQRIKVQKSKENIQTFTEQNKTSLKQFEKLNDFLTRKNEELLQKNQNLETKITSMEETFMKVREFFCMSFSQKFDKSKVSIFSIAEFENFLLEIVAFLTEWDQELKRRESQLHEKFEKQLSEKSIDGISHLITSYDRKMEPEVFQNSQFLRNEEELLKNLEQQCNKSEGNQIEKEKLIQLSEVKQNLRFTKDVNAQLFDELGRQQNMLKLCKQTFEILCNRNPSMNRDEDIRKIKTILGMKQ